jgi:hypothetical protein
MSVVLADPQPGHGPGVRAEPVARQGSLVEAETGPATTDDAFTAGQFRSLTTQATTRNRVTTAKRFRRMGAPTTRGGSESL